MAASPDWTQPEIYILITMWEEGAAASAIGKVLNRGRMAVCGKVHRLRAAGYPFTRPVRDQAAEAEANRQRRAPSPSVSRRPNAPPRAPVVVDASLAKPWLERAFNECAYPIGGEGADTVSCCQPSNGTGYCAGHRAIMFVKPKDGLERLVRHATRRAA